MIRTVLVAAVHGDLDPLTVDESPIREWQAEGRNIERFINRHITNLGSGRRRTVTRRPKPLKR
jgi:hypothetical protein